MSGSPVWMPMALSTIKPATSPRLSVIQLDFSHPPTCNRSVKAMIREAGDDIRRAANEISRIEGEFEGAVNLTVVWDQSFRVALGALNVRFLFELTNGSSGLNNWFLTDPSTLEPAKCDPWIPLDSCYYLTCRVFLTHNTMVLDNGGSVPL